MWNMPYALLIFSIFWDKNCKKIGQKWPRTSHIGKENREETAAKRRRNGACFTRARPTRATRARVYCTRQAENKNPRAQRDLILGRAFLLSFSVAIFPLSQWNFPIFNWLFFYLRHPKMPWAG